MKIKYFLFMALLTVGACRPAFAQTTITTLGATDRVDRTTLNANFNNLKQAVDAYHPSTTNHASHNFDLWSNSVVTVSNMIGIGSGIISNFTEMYVGTVSVSSIIVGTGTVSAADAANWNSNFTWYSGSYTNILYLNSNNVVSASNNYSAAQYYAADIYLYGTNITPWIFTSITNGASGWSLGAGTFTGANIFSGTNTFSTNTYAWRITRTATNYTYQARELVDYDTVVDLVGGLIANTMFGATNKHPVITANKSMIDAVPAFWATTNVLAEGTNLLGTFYWTNAITSFVPQGSYMGHFHSYLSSAKDVDSFISLVCSDGATTNVIATSDRVTLGTSIGSYDISAYVDTNYYCAGSYLGVRYYANKKTAQAASLITYGGTNYGTYLATPSLSGGIDQTLYVKHDGSVPWTGNENGGEKESTNWTVVSAHTAEVDRVQLPAGYADGNQGSSIGLLTLGTNDTQTSWYGQGDLLASRYGATIVAGGTNTSGTLGTYSMAGVLAAWGVSNVAFFTGNGPNPTVRAIVTDEGFLGTGNIITNFLQAGTFTTNTPTAGQVAKYNATDGRWYAADPAPNSWSWGYTDPLTTNANENIVRSGVISRASTITNLDTSCSGGSDGFDVIKWTSRTNAMGNYSTIYTGVTCSVIHSNVALTLSISAGEQIGIISTNGRATNAWRSVNLTTP